MALPFHTLTMTIDVWFQDDMRGQAGRTTHVWVRRRSRPTALRDIGYLWARFLDALCHSNGKATEMIEPYADTEAMNRHLEVISLQVGPETRFVLDIDQAEWRRAKGLVIPSSITLLFLPPYSPQLNMSERVWLYARDSYLSNIAMGDYEATVDRCVNAFNAIAGNPEPVKSIARCDWAHV